MSFVLWSISGCTQIVEWRFGLHLQGVLVLYIYTVFISYAMLSFKKTKKKFKISCATLDGFDLCRFSLIILVNYNFLEKVFVLPTLY